MHGRSRDEVSAVPDAAQGPARDEPTAHPGVWEVRRALARGDTSPKTLGMIAFLHPSERGAILALVQEVLGNVAAVEVEDAYRALLPPDPTEDLLAWHPSELSGDAGVAAWLLRAVEVHWVDAFAETVRHLRAYVKGARTVESVEKMPAPGYDRGVKPKREVGGGQGVYDVKLGEAPVLDTLHTLVRNHIHDCFERRAYYPHALFELGTFLRRDPGYGGSRHTQGAAIDLGGMNFATVDDVLHVLDLLPDSKVSRVFPDNNNHLHLSIHDGALELGMPFQGDFFPDSRSMKSAQHKAEASADADATTLHADGLAWGSTVMNQSTATRSGGAWKWSKPAPKSDGAAAVGFLQSKELRAKLAERMRG